MPLNTDPLDGGSWLLLAPWKPASRQDVERFLEQGLASCNPRHVAEFERIRVPLRQVEVASHPGEFVFVVAESARQVLYYSDIEDGWELDELDDQGRLGTRGSCQFDLSHILHQLFAEPAS